MDDPPPDHLALGNVDLPLLLSDGTPQGPVVFRVWGFGKACVAKLDVVRKIGWIRVIRPRFQQQHGGMRVSTNRLANTDPAAPAPMITTSYFMDPPDMLGLLSWDCSD